MPYREEPRAARATLRLRRVVFEDGMVPVMIALIALICVCALAAPVSFAVRCSVRHECAVEAVSLVGIHDDRRVAWEPYESSFMRQHLRLGEPVLSSATLAMPLGREGTSFVSATLNDFSAGHRQDVVAAHPDGPVVLAQGRFLAPPLWLLLAAFVGVPGFFFLMGGSTVFLSASFEAGVFTVRARGRRIGEKVTSFVAREVAAIESHDTRRTAGQRAATVIELVTRSDTRSSLFARDLQQSRAARRLARDLADWVTLQTADPGAAPIAAPWPSPR